MKYILIKVYYDHIELTTEPIFDDKDAAFDYFKTHGYVLNDATKTFTNRKPQVIFDVLPNPEINNRQVIYYEIVGCDDIARLQQIIQQAHADHLPYYIGYHDVKHDDIPHLNLNSVHTSYQLSLQAVERYSINNDPNVDQSDYTYAQIHQLQHRYNEDNIPYGANVITVV